MLAPVLGDLTKYDEIEAACRTIPETMALQINYAENDAYLALGIPNEVWQSWGWDTDTWTFYGSGVQPRVR